MPTLLILGGTTEARALAAACADLVPTVTSLAGRTSEPLAVAGQVRVGGFGGVDGLTRYLREQRIGAVVDATHPFAATMSAHAVAAARAAAVPLVVLRRPGWTERPGDRWHRVPSMAAAAGLLPGLGRRVFLTTGRQSIAAFAALDDCWFLSRSVEPPSPPMPRHLDVLLDRGPFGPAGERALLAGHRIDVLVTKDSGGATAKLDAARELGIPVLMVDRPPAGFAPIVAGVGDALRWLLRTGFTAVRQAPPIRSTTVS
ncbi:cobalt-precorrin-6A reductase [Jidongwangia harbinensis]|uniref:cobalt-precorrin-6A reductase n=1 Tax=Jidongwangia harbinensis TaxID=2878561 RepID=UPI001CDA488C|nr:cobalt-precorrin-6A reductase [Jidongwangia harbinensis]MCA2216529.1 cobalt-precorrin-6A reductase [Jidongwangia harbinensis]